MSDSIQTSSASVPTIIDDVGKFSREIIPTMENLVKKQTENHDMSFLKPHSGGGADKPDCYIVSLCLLKQLNATTIKVSEPFLGTSKNNQVHLRGR